MVWNLNIYYSKNYHLFYIIFSKVQTQRLYKVKKFKSKDIKIALLYNNITKLIKKKIKKIGNKSLVITAKTIQKNIKKIQLPGSILLKLI